MAKRANDAMKNFVTDAFRADFNNGKLYIRSGTQPATGGGAASGDLLVEIDLPATAFSPASAGSAAKAGTWSAAASAAGIAGWFRMTNTAGTRSIDGNVTGQGGGGDMEVENTNIASGQTVTVDSFSLAALFGA